MTDIGPAMHANHSHSVDAHEWIQCMAHIGHCVWLSHIQQLPLPKPQLAHSPYFSAFYHLLCIMSSIKHLLKEIGSVNTLLQHRNETDIGGELQASFGRALVKQIKMFKVMSPDDASTVMNAVNGCAYSQEVKQLIIASIDSKLIQAAEPGNQKQPHCSGTLKTWWTYSTQEDWDFYRDPKKFFNAKIDRLVARAHSLGLLHPDEQTYKWMLATLLISHYEELPEPKVLFSKLNELKQACAAESKLRAYPLDQLTTYPESPMELPKAVFDYAYPSGEPQPVDVQIHGLSTVADKIPLRKSSSLLKTRSAEVHDISTWKDMKAAIKGSDAKVLHVGSVGSSHNLQPIKTEVVKKEPGQSIQIKQEPALDGMIQVPAPRDTHEEALLTLYRADLWKHRAGICSAAPAKSNQLTKPADVGKAAESTQLDALVVSTSSDGSLLLRPRSDTPVKQEEPAEVKMPVHDDTDLDDYAKAALEAFGKRKISRKAAAKAAAEQTKAEKVKKSGKVKKDPATKAPAVKGEKVKIEPPVLSKSQIMQACPKGASPPVLYKGGVIYTVEKSQVFRALKVRGNKYTEASCAWGVKRTKVEAWAKVVQAIEQHKVG